MMTFYSAEQ